MKKKNKKTKTNDNKNDNTTLIHNYNLLNYYTFWCLIWYILYKLNIVTLYPLSIFLVIFIPSTYITLIYIISSKDKFAKYFFIIFISCLFHYGPLIDLLNDKNVNIKKLININFILLNLILLNLYIYYLNSKKLDMNKIYNEVYFNNKLI